jgi:hypothetical protein
MRVKHCDPKGCIMRASPSENGIDLATANGITELEKQVSDRLGGQIRHFRLEIWENGLILRGLAVTYYAKQLAQHAVMAATDLPIRANEIEVT